MLIHHRLNTFLITVTLLCLHAYTTQAANKATVSSPQERQADNFIDMNALFLSAVDLSVQAVDSKRSTPNESFVQVSNQLKSYETIRSKFVQNKTIKVLKRPLRSSGNIIFNTQQGLYWHTDTPIDTVLLISDGGITETINGKSRKLFDAGQHQTSKELFTIFSALFSGNTSTLAKYFELYFSGNTQHWVIGLVPRNSLLKKAIDKIVVSGATHVQTIQVWERGGDHTEIAFKQTASQPAELTHDEAKHFVH